MVKATIDRIEMSTRATAAHTLQFTPQLVKTLNSALSTTDTFYTALVRGGWRREA